MTEQMSSFNNEAGHDSYFNFFALFDIISSVLVLICLMLSKHTCNDSITYSRCIWYIAYWVVMYLLKACSKESLLGCCLSPFAILGKKIYDFVYSIMFLSNFVSLANCNTYFGYAYLIFKIRCVLDLAIVSISVMIVLSIMMVTFVFCFGGLTFISMLADNEAEKKELDGEK